MNVKILNELAVIRTKYSRIKTDNIIYLYFKYTLYSVAFVAFDSTINYTNTITFSTFVYLL